jgi:hypothetical protein
MAHQNDPFTDLRDSLWRPHRYPQWCDLSYKGYKFNSCAIKRNVGVNPTNADLPLYLRYAPHPYSRSFHGTSRCRSADADDDHQVYLMISPSSRVQVAWASPTPPPEILLSTLHKSSRQFRKHWKIWIIWTADRGHKKSLTRSRKALIQQYALKFQYKEPDYAITSW